MAVGLKVKYFWYPIGDEDFLHAFFSTISYHLEKGKWGKEYPTLFKKLYQGNLPWKDCPKAISELDEIKAKLKSYKPSKVVWDIDDLSLRPPWGDEISETITDLSNYFVTSEGEDIFVVFLKAFNASIENQSNVEIENL